MRTWIEVLGAACVLGSTVGLMMVHIAIDHNPQQAFVNSETGWVNYSHLSLLFLLSFMPVSLAVGLVVWLVRG